MTQQQTEPIPDSDYTVQEGDSLYSVAQDAYGDGDQWHKIYDYPENRAKIGPDPNLIDPGTVLHIPS